MQHSFDTKIAEKYGVFPAILLNNIYFWIEKSRTNNENFFDGTYWTYNSRKAFAELFPYMSERQIDYALKKLIDGGILITGNYNKMAYDRTLWYAITKKGYCILQNCEMEETKLSNGNDTVVPAIPDIITDINNDILESKKRVEQAAALFPPVPTQTEVLFDEFWASYPKKVNKKGAFKSFSKIKGLETEFPLIMDALERFKKSREWQKDGGQFIPHPTTWLNQERWKDEQEPTREQILQGMDMSDWV